MADWSDGMWMLSKDDPDGPFLVRVPTAAEASTLGRYWNAVGFFQDTGITSRLSDLEGVTVGGFTLETDPDEIAYWARSGELEFESIYES